MGKCRVSLPITKNHRYNSMEEMLWAGYVYRRRRRVDGFRVALGCPKDPFGKASEGVLSRREAFGSDISSERGDAEGEGR